MKDRKPTPLTPTQLAALYHIFRQPMPLTDHGWNIRTLKALALRNLIYTTCSNPPRWDLTVTGRKIAAKHYEDDDL